ncbi:hypothetical protein F2P79_003433 [Pimephales promelas]|nr:hypothetical protein F2P79_003433 [Pimephales promelas]
MQEMCVQRGSSEISIRRLLAKHNMRRKGHTSDSDLDIAVSRAINETGLTYGRKMMTGYLSSVGVCAGECRVGSVLRAAHTPYHEERRQGSRNLNPIPYNAEYMGHKMHLDQNEKLVMFGVTHVIAVDGHSKKIVANATMPVKNNLAIYEEVYRPAVTHYGMWDQLRVDHGKEFYLIPGRGIPNHLAGTGTPRKITTDLLPDATVAADMYDRNMGSSLTRVSSFGSDPFLSEADKVRAEQHFARYYPDLSVIFDSAVNYNYAPFKEALIYLIDVTKTCS